VTGLSPAAAEAIAAVLERSRLGTEVESSSAVAAASFLGLAVMRKG
jgi:hypothetical protein